MAESSRLDQPIRRGRRRSPIAQHERFGRISERIARFIGSWAFIFWMTFVILAWIAWNTVMPSSYRFDPYAFLLLTLTLSLQASYAAPLILLAQNRQSDRDRVQYQDDRANTERLIADAEFLSREIAALRIAVGELATRDYVRAELRAMLEELHDQHDGSAQPERNA
ncbi:MAG: hypothetical protein RL745_736 [Actinomycetota bacterium]|jgi:uncharacterized membrane protein